MKCRGRRKASSGARVEERERERGEVGGAAEFFSIGTLNSPLLSPSPPSTTTPPSTFSDPYSPFFLNEQPSVSLAFPPVGVHSTAEHAGQTTTVCELENTTVIWKQPWHLTSMK